MKDVVSHDCYDTAVRSLGRVGLALKSAETGWNISTLDKKYVMIDECKAPLYAFLFFINGSVYIIYITPSFQILDNEMRSVIDRKDLYESILMSLLKSFK